MVLERELTPDEMRQLDENPEDFFKSETQRLEKYLMRKSIINPNEPKSIASRIIVCKSSEKAHVSISVYEFKEIDYKKLDEPIYPYSERDIEFDPIYFDKKLGEYGVIAYIPGIREDEIKISFKPGYMEIDAGPYHGKVGIPRGIVEMNKKYKHGVLEVKLR